MIRCGHGYDAHRLIEGRKLILGGLEIAYPLGLLGHSDADVLTHAIIDAILGALGAGDIGRHFPDHDQQYKDINSLVLLDRVYHLMISEGYEIGNIDATIITQLPKLSPYLDRIKVILAQSLHCPPGSVNIKAKTTEGMGFEGRGEGISAHCVCLIVK